MEFRAIQYDLYGCYHYGSLGGGHYTAYAKNLINDLWYHLDDSSVKPIKNVQQIQTLAGICFIL